MGPRGVRRVGPLGIAAGVAIVILERGVGREPWLWFMLASCFTVGPLFTLVALRRSVYLPLGTTTERRDTA